MLQVETIGADEIPGGVDGELEERCRVQRVRRDTLEEWQRKTRLGSVEEKNVVTADLDREIRLQGKRGDVVR